MSHCVNQNCLNILAAEIKSSEKDLEDVQNIFTQAVLESIGRINSTRLKVKLCVEEVLDKQRALKLKQIEYSCFPGKQDVSNQINFLQKELKKNVNKSGWSIKLSFMKLNNLLAQYDLLFLPFCELKAYYNQLLSQKECDILRSKTEIATKLSYAEALQNIKEISHEIEQTRKRISSLTEEQKSLESSGYLDFFTNEYKSLPMAIY